MAGRGWLLALAAASGLAAASLASNTITDAQLSGRADTLLAARFTTSKLVNSGTVWAGLAVLSGWLVRRPLQAFVAGIAACLFALAAHYGSGQILGMFDADVWAENRYWFAAAMVLGGPLGLVGAIARRPCGWGRLARMVVPLGAVLEPFVLGMFTEPSIVPWPDRVSSLIGGVILLVGGVLGGVVVLASKKRSAHRTTPQPDGAEHGSGSRSARK